MYILRLLLWYTAGQVFTFLVRPAHHQPHGQPCDNPCLHVCLRGKIPCSQQAQGQAHRLCHPRPAAYQQAAEWFLNKPCYNKRDNRGDKQQLFRQFHVQRKSPSFRYGVINKGNNSSSLLARSEVISPTSSKARIRASASVLVMVVRAVRALSIPATC